MRIGQTVSDKSNVLYEVLEVASAYVICIDKNGKEVKKWSSDIKEEYDKSLDYANSSSHINYKTFVSKETIDPEAKEAFDNLSASEPADPRAVLIALNALEQMMKIYNIANKSQYIDSQAYDIFRLEYNKFATALSNLNDLKNHSYIDRYYDAVQDIAKKCGNDKSRVFRANSHNNIREWAVGDKHIHDDIMISGALDDIEKNLDSFMASMSISSLEDILDLYDDNELCITDQDGRVIDHIPHETSYDDPEDATENSFVVEANISRQERIRRALRMRKYSTRLHIKRKLAVKYPSSIQKISHRARRKAIRMLKNQLMHGSPYGTSTEYRKKVESMVRERKNLISTMTSRLIPKIKQIEHSRMATHVN